MSESTRILFDVPLAQFTTFGIGGNADRLVVTCDAAVVCEEILAGALLIGGGSNLLIGDGGIRGSIVRFVSNECRPKIIGKTSEKTVVYFDACTFLPRAAKWAAGVGLSGLEWAAGIPGTLGGAVKMNAGAHGGNISDVILFADTSCGRMPCEKLGLSYRKSNFEGAVTGVALSLTQSDSERVAEKTETLLAMRKKAQPSARSAGSVYKSVNGVSAYKYIIGCGLCGFSVGGAQISEKHANFIINKGGATAHDVLELMKKTETEVYRKYGISLEREILTLGEF